MMHGREGKVAWAGVIVLVLWLCKCLLRQVRLVRVAKQNGCLRANRYKHKDPFMGLDLLKDQMQAMQAGDGIGPEMQRFHKYGKTYETLSWGTKMFYTMERKVVQAISTTSFEHFGVADMRYPASMPLLGSNIFTTDGQRWEYYRNIIKPIFARAQVQDISPFSKYVDEMMKSLPRDGTTVDLQHHFKILDAIPSASNPESSQAYQLTQAFDRAMKGIHKRWFFGTCRFLLGPQHSYKEDCRKVHRIVDAYINNAFEEKSKTTELSGDTAGRKVVFLDELVKQYAAPTPEIRDQLLGIFFPARDTSAITLSNVFWLLARHPQVLRKLREEIVKIDRPLTFESLKSLKYLHSVINETLRLVLPAQTGVVKSNKDTVLPAGGGPDGSSPLFIPENSYITFNWRAMHRDQDFWGEDAETFRPERWSEMRPPHWEFVPFSGGRRICPAQQMALTEISIVVVRMLQTFGNIRNRDPVEKYVEGFNFTMESRRGVQVALLPQDKDINT